MSSLWFCLQTPGSPHRPCTLAVWRRRRSTRNPLFLGRLLSSRGAPGEAMKQGGRIGDSRDAAGHVERWSLHG
jgi:hypothetical protein